MTNLLNFLTIDLNGANNMNFDDLRWPKSESFHITDEMLDDCDINESVTLESISMPNVCSPRAATKSNAVQSHSPLSSTKIEPEHQPNSATIRMNESNDSHKNTTADNVETSQTGSAVDQRCKDEIFGEFVVATLKKLPTDEKKRVKKQIMDILLEM